MSSLLYGVSCLKKTVFPAGSKEHSAVQGCAAKAGCRCNIVRCFDSITRASRQRFTPSTRSLANAVRSSSVPTYAASKIFWLARESQVATIPRTKHWISVSVILRHRMALGIPPPRGTRPSDWTHIGHTTFPSHNVAAGYDLRLDIPSRSDATSPHPRLI